MCNLSDSIEERGIQKGIQIAANAKCVAALMNSMSVSFEKAIELLKIDPSEREMCKQLVEQIK